MKVVLDTNVLISGFVTTTGVPAAVLTRVLSKHEAVMSKYILEEFKSKMISKLKFLPQDLETTIHYFQTRCLFLDFIPMEGVEFGDKKDIPILALVKASRAQALITGDKKLLVLKRFFKAVIISPREALEIL